MPSRKPVPTIWLMTDERMGNALWPALRRLPPGAGVVLRHYRTPAGERRALIRRVRRIVTARRLVLVVAGGAAGADGIHGSRPAQRQALRTAGAHDRREAIRATRRGATVLFVSPLFPTRSHPGTAALGPSRASGIARGLNVAVIALGGMTRRSFLRISHHGFDGWAAIDAWTADQKRKAVPI